MHYKKEVRLIQSGTARKLELAVNAIGKMGLIEGDEKIWDKLTEFDIFSLKELKV